MQPPIEFAPEPERRVQDRPALFDHEPIVRTKQNLPNDIFKVSISSLSVKGSYGNSETTDKAPDHLSTENDALKEKLNQLKIKSVSDSFRNKAYKIAPPDRGLTKQIPIPELKAINSKPKLAETPMATSSTAASKEKVMGELFTFDEVALKTLEKIGPTAQKNIFGSYNPKNSTVERIAADDDSINLVYSHSGKDAVAIKIYGETKTVNEKEIKRIKLKTSFANSKEEAIENLKNSPPLQLFRINKEGLIQGFDNFPYFMYLANEAEAEKSPYHSISSDLKNLLKQYGYELVRKDETQPYTGLKQK